MKQITALIPTFNRSEFLVETLEAILLQKRAISQIIVWDDGSTDNTAEVIAPFLESLGDQISYTQAPNGGKSQALNQAMKLATGDYIWICDDDDIALPEASEKLAAVLDDNPSIGLVAARHERFSVAQDDGTRVVSDTGYWPDLETGSPLRHTLEDIFFFQNATLVRRECYDAVGPFSVDLARSIDYDMTVRLMTRFEAVVLEDTVFLQRKHDGVRGPASQRHAASKSEEVWCAADMEIFKRLRPVLPLSLYAAMFEHDDPRLCERAALLQRGAVYARRQDWTAAFEDFHAAISACPDLGLTETEVQIACRAVAGKHGSSGLFSSSSRSQLLDIAQTSVAGKDFARAISRGSIWRLREAVQGADFMRALAIGRVLLANPPFLTTQPSELQERSHLPQEAYAW